MAAMAGKEALRRPREPDEPTRKDTAIRTEAGCWQSSWVDTRCLRGTNTCRANSDRTGFLRWSFYAALDECAVANGCSTPLQTASNWRYRAAMKQSQPRTYASSATSCPRSAFAAAMIFV
jgi:hypothetical protein